MKSLATAALNAPIPLKFRSRERQKDGVSTLYCKAVNYLLETYSTNDEIGETEPDMMHINRMSNKPLIELAEELWNKVVRCDRLYEEYLLKGIFPN